MSRPLRAVEANRPAPAPPHLSEPSRAWYERVAAGWELGEAELELLQLACETRDRYAAAKKMLDEEGLVLRDRFGQQKAHPAAAIERDARIALVRIVRELGLEEEAPPQPYEPLALRQRRQRR